MKRYELSTLKDIFEKVPADKIDCCLKELAVMMKQTHAMNEIIGCAMDASVMEKPQNVLTWPDSVTWIDDDKGIVETNIIDPRSLENRITIKTTLSGKVNQ